MAGIHHIGLYTLKMEELIEFYVKYFDGEAGDIYHNSVRGFFSCFIRFDSVAPLEIMTLQNGLREQGPLPHTGYAHIAFDVGSRRHVDELTARMKQEGVTVVSGPRVTGDGSYESCVLDPDGNPVEITCN